MTTVFEHRKCGGKIMTRSIRNEGLVVDYAVCAGCERVIHETIVTQIIYKQSMTIQASTTQDHGSSQEENND